MSSETELAELMPAEWNCVNGGCCSIANGAVGGLVRDRADDDSMGGLVGSLRRGKSDVVHLYYVFLFY